MEKKKILAIYTCCNFWFAYANQKEKRPVFGRYGLTREQAIANFKESFPEFKDNGVVEQGN
jgi:hypothetical protein